MRPDTPASATPSGKTAIAYADRWNEWSPLVLLSMNGDRSTLRYQSFRQIHQDRITLLHRTLGISLRTIVNRSLDDPRIEWDEFQCRILAARLSRDKMNPWKNKKGIQHANK